MQPRACHRFVQVDSQNEQQNIHHSCMHIEGMIHMQALLICGIHQTAVVTEKQDLRPTENNEDIK